MDEDQEDQSQQEKPDPNVYQPDQDDDDDEIDRRIRRANERLRRMMMVGFPQINETFGCQDTLTVEGGFETGWAINYIDCGQALAGGGGGDDDTGACCIDGDCSILTGGDCASSGGEFQGSGTTCTPNPCLGTTTGACCVGSDCSITTEDDCAGMGGTYQGDDTVCDPNPCMMDCSCGFDACDGSGRRFLTQVTTVHIVKGQSCLNSDPTLTCENGIDGTRVTTITYDPSDCSFTSNTVRSGDWSLIGGFETLTFHRCNGTTGHTDPISCGGLTCLSATEEYCFFLAGTFNHPTCTPAVTTLTVEETVILSDECNPI